MSKKGVTLLELIIVVLIVGILAVLAVPKFTGLLEKAKYSECSGIFGAIKVTQLVYYDENENYAEDIVELDTDIPLQDERYFEYGMRLFDTDGIDWGYTGFGIEYHAMADTHFGSSNAGDKYPHIHDVGGVGYWIDPGMGTNTSHSHGDIGSHTHEATLSELLP